MSQIYLRDETLKKDYRGGGNKRTIDVINFIFTKIIPRPLSSIRPTRLGYIAIYPNEEDANYFFRVNIVDKLKAKSLKPRLHYDTQEVREIVVLDIPDDIYDYDDPTIIAELEYRNEFNIIEFEKYLSLKSHRKYIKVALDSKEAREAALNKGKVRMFYAQLDVQKKNNTSATNQLCRPI